MKEHPILFSAPMILALLAGTKTQTRRIMSPQPQWAEINGGCWTFPAPRRLRNQQGTFAWAKSEFIDTAELLLEQSPFGQPGDRLWVRETCRAEELPDGTNGVRYIADNHFRPIDNTPEAAEQWMKLYHYGKRRGATVPPIHAPRWTSRILLEKVAGRVEQLQDITEADANAEGCEDYDDDVTGGQSAYSAYAELWASLHGPGSWEGNPWLWVEEFKRIRP